MDAESIPAMNEALAVCAFTSRGPDLDVCNPAKGISHLGEYRDQAHLWPPERVFEQDKESSHES